MEGGKPGEAFSLGGCPAKTSWQANQPLETKQAGRPTQTPQEVYVHKGGSSLFKDLKINSEDFLFLIKGGWVWLGFF